MNKRAFVFRTLKFAFFVLGIILLVFLIKNQWDAPAAIAEMISFLPGIE